MTIRLTDPQQDRYERLRLIRWWDQEKLRNANVLILGAGALGNEVLKNLALLGAGNIWVVDFDLIETSNLTRSVLFRREDVGRRKAEVAAERAAAINPDCRITPLHADVRHDLGFDFLRKFDVIFGCLDNREARYFINRFCYLLNKIWIDGGLDALNGSVSVFSPPSSACYECTLTASDRAELQKRISCLKSTDPEIKQHIPTAPTIASIVGGLQAQIGVRAIHGLPIPAGKRQGLYGLSDVQFQIELEISEECGLHAVADPLPDVIEQLSLPQDATLQQILNEAAIRWNADALVWDFDRDLIVSLECTACGSNRSFYGTHGKYQDSALCACSGTLKPVVSDRFAGEQELGRRSFLELGFPNHHIYCAKTADRRVYFTLSS